MDLHRLKKTIARVDLNGEPNGTAFLVDRHHVATAFHVLDGRQEVELVFLDWDREPRRVGKFKWRHPAGHDVAILELDRECEGDAEPLPWITIAGAGDAWFSWGFPSQVPEGRAMIDEKVTDPSR
ncbi:MAG: serine protease, partial [Prosthecobacter sp.]|nr:serine protease [Prosthecobacter sp.]